MMLKKTSSEVGIWIYFWQWSVESQIVLVYLLLQSNFQFSRRGFECGVEDGDVTLFPKWLILSLCTVDVCLVVTELLNTGRGVPGRVFCKLIILSFSLYTAVFLLFFIPSGGTFPTVFSDCDRHLPATICLTTWQIVPSFFLIRGHAW